MIKKIFTLTIIYIFTLLNVSAFLGESNGLDLYKNIEKGMADLKLKSFEYEISGGGKSISDEVNKILKYNNLPECIKPGLNSKDFNLISYGNIDTLIINLKTIEGCYYKESININTLNSINSAISTMNVVYRQKADNKSDDIYKISRIGLYSDGNLDNSSFDLISDIEEIDKIIFTKEIPYNGEEIGNFDSIFGNFLAGNNTNIAKPLVTTDFLQNNNNLGGSIININNNVTILPIQTNNSDKYVCSQDNQTSGFSKDILNILIPINSSGSNLLNTGNTPLINSSGTTINSGSISGTGNNLDNNNSNIINLNTVGNWPCNTFFCIKIDFQTYSTNLLGGGNAFSIESYMNTSNGHLKKFSGTSLVQSRMTINQFQLGLKNLQLSDIVHMLVMLTLKSPPILKDDVRKKGEYEKRLRKYYKNNGKNYDKQNSLSLYLDKQKEKKTVSNSAEMPILTVKERDTYLKNRQALERKQNKLVENEFDHKILYEDMDIFYDKFIPLESFTTNILNYSDNVSIIIKGMNDKPSN